MVQTIAGSELSAGSGGKAETKEYEALPAGRQDSDNKIIIFNNPFVTIIKCCYYYEDIYPHHLLMLNICKNQ